MLGPKSDHADLSQNKGAQSSDLDDMPFFRGAGSRLVEAVLVLNRIISYVGKQVTGTRWGIETRRS